MFKRHHPRKTTQENFFEDRPSQLDQDEVITEGRLGEKMCNVVGRGYFMGNDAEVRKSKATSSDCVK